MKAGHIALGVVGAMAVVGLGAAGFVKVKSDAVLARTYDLHTVDIPMPFPLSDDELAALRAANTPPVAALDAGVVTDGAPAAPIDPLAGLDMEALTMERAVARGKHLIEARYACSECHGQDLGGGVMMDVPPVAVAKGPNLTLGEGGVTKDYTMNDWDRIVRHGVRKDGHVAIMPSEDFAAMSDQELSDIVAAIRSFPPVDRTVEPVTYGPVGRMLAATGQFVFSAESLASRTDHPTKPPAEGPTAEYGQHLAQACVGCHNTSFTGGPMVGGDPSWAEPANLTPAEDGLAGWTGEDFKRAMREGKRPDGAALKPPMDLIPKFGQKMTDTEIDAMWAFFSTLPPKATGEK